MGRQNWLKSPEDAKTLAQKADKHDCYHQSVQCPKKEITSLLNYYTRFSPALISIRPLLFREDFCGTAILCKEWIKRHPEHEAIGVDIDQSVLEYSEKTQDYDFERLRLIHSDVLQIEYEQMNIPAVDIYCALNYGIFYFKSTSTLKKYFKKVLQGLKSNGIFVCDIFGGTQCFDGTGKNTIRKYPNFTYYFQQKSFNVLNNVCKGSISFQFKDGSWLKNAFQYEFRIYSMIEVKEALLQSGFKQVRIYYANSEEDAKGDCDGVYYYNEITEEKELAPALSWNAYFIATK